MKTAQQEKIERVEEAIEKIEPPYPEWSTDIKSVLVAAKDHQKLAFYIINKMPETIQKQDIDKDQTISFAEIAIRTIEKYELMKAGIYHITKKLKKLNNEL